MSNKTQRFITAAVGIPIVLSAVFFASKELFFLLLALFAGIGMHEFIKMIRASGRSVDEKSAWVAFAVSCFGFYYNDGSQLHLFLTLSIIAVFVFKLFSKEALEDTLGKIGFSLLAVFFVPVLFMYVYPVWLKGAEFLFYLFIVIWCSDSFAYLGGIKFGKRRLYEKISPKKSIEGLLFGLAGAVIGGLIYAVFTNLMPVFHIIASSLIVAVAGVVGDLAESMIKRYCGVKDSGTIIPGHGGVLDRVDSILFGAPILYMYLTLMAV